MQSTDPKNYKSMAPAFSRGKVGAPAGNSNALKHGLYSRHISSQDAADLQSMSLERNDQELALARVRLKECILKQQTAPPEDWIKYEKAISHYIAIIVSNTNKNALLGRESRASFVTVLEMILQVNEEQDIK